MLGGGGRGYSTGAVRGCCGTTNKYTNLRHTRSVLGGLGRPVVPNVSCLLTRCGGRNGNNFTGCLVFFRSCQRVMGSLGLNSDRRIGCPPRLITTRSETMRVQGTLGTRVRTGGRGRILGGCGGVRIGGRGRCSFSTSNFIVVIPPSTGRVVRRNGGVHRYINNCTRQRLGKALAVLFLHRTSGPGGSLCAVRVRNGRLTRIRKCQGHALLASRTGTFFSG